jgi:hypothetical protein
MVGWLISYMGGRLFGYLVCAFFIWLVGWLVDYLVVQVVCYLDV